LSWPSRSGRCSAPANDWAERRWRSDGDLKWSRPAVLLAWLAFRGRLRAVGAPAQAALVLLSPRRPAFVVPPGASPTTGATASTWRDPTSSSRERPNVSFVGAMGRLLPHHLDLARTLGRALAAAVVVVTVALCCPWGRARATPDLYPRVLADRGGAATAAAVHLVFTSSWTLLIPMVVVWTWVGEARAAARSSFWPRPWPSPTSSGSSGARAGRRPLVLSRVVRDDLRGRRLGGLRPAAVGGSGARRSAPGARRNASQRPAVSEGRRPANRTAARPAFGRDLWLTFVSNLLFALGLGLYYQLLNVYAIRNLGAPRFMIGALVAIPARHGRRSATSPAPGRPTTCVSTRSSSPSGGSPCLRPSASLSRRSWPWPDTGLPADRPCTWPTTRPSRCTSCSSPSRARMGAQHLVCLRQLSPGDGARAAGRRLAGRPLRHAPGVRRGDRFYVASSIVISLIKGHAVSRGPASPWEARRPARHQGLPAQLHLLLLRRLFHGVPGAAVRDSQPYLSLGSSHLGLHRASWPASAAPGRQRDHLRRRPDHRRVWPPPGQSA